MGEFCYSKLGNVTNFWCKISHSWQTYWFQISPGLQLIPTKLWVYHDLKLYLVHRRTLIFQTDFIFLHEHSIPNSLEIASQRSLNWRIPRNSLTWVKKLLGYGQNHWMAIDDVVEYYFNLMSISNQANIRHATFSLNV